MTPDLYPPDYERVPTQPELYARGLAVVVERNSKGEPTHYRVKPEGETILSATMRRNAERGRAWDRERRAR